MTHLTLQGITYLCQNRSIVRLTLVVLALLATNGPRSSLAAEQTMPLSGGWAARLDIASTPTLLWLKVTENTAHEFVASVFMDPSPIGVRQFSSIKITTQASSWTLVAGEPPNELRLEVRKDADGFTADYKIGTAAGRADLRRVSGDAAFNRRVTGAYILPSGDKIYVRTGSQGPDKILSYLEEKTGRSGFLYQTAANSYVGGTSYALPDPVGVRVTFEDNPTARLVWRSSDTKDLTATKGTAYRREDVHIPVDGAALGCEVLIPTGPGKHPAAVFVPGSGAVDRFASYYIQADLLAQHNVASLVCDKRGTGVSTGDWRSLSFEQQAQDIVAGMQYLRHRAGIDPSRVGIWANSQGTYPAPIAALEGEASFLILIAEFAISSREGVMISNVERMRRNGAPAEEIARYQDYFGRWQQAIMDDDFAAYERLQREYAGASWLMRNVPSEKAWSSDWQNDRARLMWPYQPGLTLRKIRVPVLAFWGSEDPEALPTVHKPALEQALRDGGNSDYSLRVIAGADHRVWVGASGIEKVGYAPEYISGMLEWLRTKVITAPREVVRDAVVACDLCGTLAGHDRPVSPGR
jgi:pimeloyl-ACP methyl ester carboxylesterase